MENKVFENAITNKQLKESLGDAAIALLVNQNLITLEKDLKHLVIEFGYLFINHQNQPSAMLKMTIPKKLFKPERIYYFGTQDGKLLLLDNNFNEETFRKIQNDMFVMHKVDVININRNDYKMELY